MAERKREEAEVAERSNSGATDKESRYWAMVSGNVRDEFLRLGTDEEKRIWLLRQTILKRYPKGKEFLNS